jgi:hypothetical protein
VVDAEFVDSGVCCAVASSAVVGQGKKVSTQKFSIQWASFSLHFEKFLAMTYLRRGYSSHNRKRGKSGDISESLSL